MTDNYRKTLKGKKLRLLKIDRTKYTVEELKALKKKVP